MSSRYQNIPTKKNENGKLVTTSVIYPPIPRTTEDIYVLTTPGDRLDLLAYRYYQDVNKSWIIAEANALGKGVHTLPAGTQLRIPANIENILEQYELLNS
jgi:phage tail protein X